MIKNKKKFQRETELQKKTFLNSLTINKSARILENLISSRLLSMFIKTPEGHPISLKKALNHAKFT